jgi:hypothetical protein
MNFARKQLGISIVQRYKASLPPSNFQTAVLDDIQERVTNIGRKCINRCQFEYFGSFASKFCTKTADADFSLTWSGYNPLLQGNEKFDDIVNKKLLRFAKCASEEGMNAVRHVASRIPVVQFEDVVHPEIIVDVSAGNNFGVENSKILREIHDYHPLIPLYIYAIKTWAKSKQVIAPEFGTFNSFTITTMALAVLQELGLLPVFRFQSGMWGELTFNDAKTILDESKSSKLHPALAGLNSKLNDDAAMGDAVIFLLSKFAEYYTNFDFEKGTISLTHPRQLRTLYKEQVKMYLEGMKASKQSAWEIFHLENTSFGAVDLNELSQAMHNEELQRTSVSPFCVIDLVNLVNCGRRVHLPRKQIVLDHFVDLHQKMSKNPNLTVDELFQPLNKLKPTVTDFDTKTGERRVTRF